MQLSNHEHNWLTSKGAEMMAELGLSAGNSAIDFGCGKGRYTIPLSQALGQRGNVTAIERDADELDQLQTRASTFPTLATITPLQTSDLSLGSIPDNTVDAVLAFDVLQYVKDWPGFFTAVNRVLNTSGTLHIYPAAIPHPDAIDLNQLTTALTTTNFQLKAQRKFTMMHNKDMVTDAVYTFSALHTTDT